MTKKRAALVALIIFAGVILARILLQEGGNFFFRKVVQPSIPASLRAPDADDIPIKAIAENLSIPWEIAFLPDGDMLVTERPGTLKRIGKNRQTYPISGVAHRGEGGLLGLALHPRFSENHLVYLYLTTPAGSGLINRVERYTLTGDTLADRTETIGNIPGSAVHDGGRIAFGPDGFLYITTGDAGQSRLAQDIRSLAGKILRIRDDGSVPSDNPFGNAVWSYGHRNPQGLAWDDRGRLWATEHGRSIPFSGYDELNLIEKGGNYGWPDIQGDRAKPDMERPIIHSGPSTTWAPAGAAFLNGSIFFGGLKGTALYQAKITGERNIALTKHFEKAYGRIRAVVKGPDDMLYISTSNTDGRGEARPGDDNIIRINPRAL